MAHLPLFPADYPGAIVVPAAKYGYSGAINRPRAWGLHTPEEPPDDQPSTPYYFHNLTDRNASTTYFVSYLGFVFQMVPEDEGAYANAVVGKPYPVWADSTITLNLQTLNVEIEGYSSTIHRTMPRGSPQWNALVSLLAHRCIALGIPPERTFGHYEVSNQRGDPGQLNILLLVSDVIDKMEEAMALDETTDWEKFKRMAARFWKEGRVSALDSKQDPIPNTNSPGRWAGVGLETRTELNDHKDHGPGGISEADARAIARAEDDKLKLTK